MIIKRKTTVISVALALGLAPQSLLAHFDPILELSELNGQNGFTINGVSAGDKSGISISSAGDVNGDGIDDVIIGALYGGLGVNDTAGSSYVVFGSDSTLPNPFELSSINGLNGFILNGVASGDFSGFSVSAAGDINGDNIDDLIIGAPFTNPSGNGSTGSSYVVFGSDSLMPNPFDLSTINGSNGFTLNGVAINNLSGRSVSSAGDFNADGIDDLIIGAPFASPGGNSYAGSSYVVFGSDNDLPNPFNLASINGINGFTFNGVAANDNSGRSVSSAGDFNGDGIDDLIIGAYGADPGGISGAGSSYVVFGSSSPLGNPFDLNSINGINGFIINGVAAGEYSSRSVSTAGDFNGDGLDDLIIGAYGADPGGKDFAGSSYVVFGSDSPMPNPFELSTINGLNGITINGAVADDRLGRSVSTAGDVNGDGIDDVIIGAINADSGGNSNAGSSYVVFGSDNLLPNPFDLAILNGHNGFTLNGVAADDQSGYSVSSAGDVNGDGIDDLIISASLADPGGNDAAGSSYVVFGNDVIFKNGFD